MFKIPKIGIGIGLLVLIASAGIFLRRKKTLHLVDPESRPSFVFKKEEKKNLSVYKKELQANREKKKDEYKERKKIVNKVEHTLSAKEEEEDNGEYVWEVDENEMTHFLARPSYTQRVAQGQPLVKIKLQEDAELSSMTLKKGTILLGTVLLRGNRAHIFITAAEKDDRTIPVKLKVIDMDYQDGIYCEDINENMYQEAEKTLIDEALRSLSFSPAIQLGRRLYRVYKGKQKILLSRERRFYVSEPPDEKK